jgi:hypothetical protein
MGSLDAVSWRLSQALELWKTGWGGFGQDEECQ